MTALYDRLEEAQRLLTYAEEARQQHGYHPHCDICKAIDLVLDRARREWYLYRLAYARSGLAAV